MEILDPGMHPRPQLRRARWQELVGGWTLASDEADAGRAGRWFAEHAEQMVTEPVVVPYPPESRASGVADRSPRSIRWYRRAVTADELSDDLFAGDRRRRTLLHFGAVDHHADVFFDGQHVGAHTGGQTPFTVDLTAALDRDASTHLLVVRVRDDEADAEQPRGKQTWRPTADKVWYDQTSGIWQTVWIENVPGLALVDLYWRTDVTDGVDLTAELSARPVGDAELRVTLELDGRRLGRAVVAARTKTVRLRVPVPELANGIDREELLWSPEQPVLVDARVELHDAVADTTDEVQSYLGIRTVGVGGGRFLLNGRPYQLRGVLNQGYRPATHLANQGSDELRAEVELARSLGFNLMRMHQKAEDPRLLHWADRLGLLIWVEVGAAYTFSTAAARALLADWVDIVQRDRSHPSVMAWVPINESWGFPDLATDAAQRAFAVGIADVTRALDPTRLVMTNEGWEHLDSDILGVHDYTDDPAELRARYADPAALAAELRHPGVRAGGRAIALTERQAERFRDGTAPLMITEFGGLAIRSSPDTFAYAHLGSEADLEALLTAMFDALRACPAVAGWCYTQLFDTAQETNGLADDQGKPKLPVDRLRAIVLGDDRGL